MTDETERLDFTYSIWKIIEDGRWGGQLEKEKASKGACAILSRRDELMMKRGMLELVKKMKGHWEIDDLDVFNMKFDTTIKDLEREIKEMGGSI